MILSKLQEMKEDCQMTYQEIAEKSGIPISTVRRIFSGQTPDPGVTTIFAIAKAMGGSVEDMKDDTPEQQKSDNELPEKQKGDTVSRLSAELLISLYKRSIDDKNKLIKALFVIVLSMMAIFIFLLVWDLCNPSIGFIRR